MASSHVAAPSARNPQPLQVPKELVAPVSAARPRCRFFQEFASGKCRKGAKCPFRHETKDGRFDAHLPHISRWESSSDVSGISLRPPVTEGIPPPALTPPPPMVPPHSPAPIDAAPVDVAAPIDAAPVEVAAPIVVPPVEVAAPIVVPPVDVPPVAPRRPPHRYLHWQTTECPDCRRPNGQFKYDPAPGLRDEPTWHMRVMTTEGVWPTKGHQYRRRHASQVGDSEDFAKQWIWENKTCC